MKFKKLLSLGLVTVLASSMLVGCSSTKSEGGDAAANGDDKMKVIMITDVGGVNDESFNQCAWEGLGRAKEEFGVEVEITYLESKQDQIMQQI